MTQELPNASIDVGALHSALADAVTRDIGLVPQGCADQHSSSVVWAALPQLLSKVPENLRREDAYRLSVAVATGLFDAALNYGWNIAVMGLRMKFVSLQDERLPLAFRRSILPNNVETLYDWELLDLCQRYYVISSNCATALGNTRNDRNTKSAAHPSDERVDATGLVEFLSTCWSNVFLPVPLTPALKIANLLQELYSATMNKQQVEKYRVSLVDTMSGDGVLAVRILHGLYCEQPNNSIAKKNAALVCKSISTSITEPVLQELYQQHKFYSSGGGKAGDAQSQYLTQCHKRSTTFFAQIIRHRDRLPNTDRQWHTSAMCDMLMRVHNARDNFYNEPGWAEELFRLLDGRTECSKAVSYNFVETIVVCAIGDGYGVSNRAVPIYHEMIKRFDRRQVEIVLSFPGQDCAVQRRLKRSPDCRQHFSAVVNLIDEKLVPTSLIEVYQSWKIGV